MSADPPSLYLDPADALGARWCFDPDSPALRAALTAPKPGLESPVDARALEADLADLRGYLRHQYSGYPELVQRPTFDPDDWFDAWAASLRGGPATLPFQTAVLEPLVALRRAHRDNHLMVSGYGLWLSRHDDLVIREHQAPAERDDLTGCAARAEGGAIIPGTLRIAPTLGGAPLVTVSALGADAAVTLACPEGERPLAPRPLAARPDDWDSRPPYSLELRDGAALVTVRRLWGDAEALASLEQIAEDLESYRDQPLVVFDFRGNGGGNDGYIYAWIDRAHRGAWSGGVSVSLRGAMGDCGAWNWRVAAQIRHGEADTDAARAEREGLRAGWGQPRALHAAHAGLVTSGAQAPYEGRVVALVDRSSASSGESGPEALRRALGARIIGERTGGFLEFGNLRDFVMPRTGIVWKVPSKRNYFDGPAEGVGLAPDAYLPPAQIGAPAAALLPLLADEG